MSADAEIKVAEAMLQHARGISQSPDPETRLAATKFEIKLTRQLKAIKKRQQRSSHAAPQRD